MTTQTKVDELKRTTASQNAMVERLQSPELREELATWMHDYWVRWTKHATNNRDIDREFLFIPFDRLNAVNKLAPLRDADNIIALIRGDNQQ